MSAVSKLFLELTSETVPHGAEDAFASCFLPKEAVRDAFGNWVVDVPGGNGRVMFSSHLDDVSTVVRKVNHRIFSDGRVSTDGTTILGADCKAGVAVMLEMIRHGKPGHYVFHADEERGGRPGDQRAKAMSDLYSNFDMAIAFDRRAYGSIITKMRGVRTCSDEFARALADRLGIGGPDDTGSFTDTRSYIQHIPECTNLSVGYDHAHSISEWQSLPYLEWLTKRALAIRWDDLPVVRKASPEPLALADDEDPALFGAGKSPHKHIVPPPGASRIYTHPNFGTCWQLKPSMVAEAFLREAARDRRLYDWHEDEVMEIANVDEAGVPLRLVHPDPSKCGGYAYAVSTKTVFTRSSELIVVCGTYGEPLVCPSRSWLRLGD
jgi:hypothetical protein